MTEPVGWNNTHFYASVLVPSGCEVLDIGCGPGVVGSVLLRAGCSVVGVDADKEKADVAEEAGLEVLLADVEADDGLRPLDGRQFDVVLGLDVLEHLRDPAPVLRRIAQLVRPTGVVIVSIPNMSHAAVRLAMLEGRLERTDEGLLDRTHLQWYDRKLVEQLFVGADLQILERLSVKRRVDETEIPVDLDRIPDDVLTLIDQDPDADVYQFVYVASVDRAIARWPHPHPAVVLIEELQRASDVIRSATAYARELEAHITAGDVDRQRLREALSAAETVAGEHLRSVADAQDQVAQRTAELDDAHREIAYFESELRFRDIQLVDLRHQMVERNTAIEALQAAVAAYQAQVEAFAADAAWARQQWEVDATELRRLQAREEDFLRLRNSAGYRFADAVTDIVRRNRIIYGVARRLVRMVAGRPHP